MTKVISDRFKVFATRECQGSSQLYEHLSLKMADDDELLQLASHAGEGQPIPNLFFGAVHYLLLKGNNHELIEYYASIVNNPREAETAFASFKDFCLRHCYIYEKTNRPLALIEIGTSTGLQLFFDKYCYSYNSNELFGNEDAELIIKSEIRGDQSPFLLKHSPPVASRIGVDLHINDLKDPEDYLWLKSLIWPEHTERMMNFEKAVRCLQKQSLELIEGNGVKLLTEIAAKIPQESVVCIFHTHVANQMSQEDKHELIQRIQNLGKIRDVFHIYNNMWDLHLHLDYFLDGEEHKGTIAETDGHGRWFQWMGDIV